MKKVLALGAALICALCLSAEAANSPTFSPTVATITTSITRPSNSTPYSANQALADSTSSPTVGGFTFASACDLAGDAGQIVDATVTASAGTAYQGEIWVFDQAVTAQNDAATFTVSAANLLNRVAVIPFNTNDTANGTAISYVTAINQGYTCVGTTALRFLIKILNAPTPASAEVISIRLHVSN